MESLEDGCAQICSIKEQRIKENILEKIINCISENLSNQSLFEYWISSSDSTHDFANIYETSYKDEGYSVVLTNEDIHDFFMMGKNISYYLQTLSFEYLCKYNNKVKNFIKLQLDDSDNWCEAEQKMYEYLLEHNGELLHSEENPV